MDLKNVTLMWIVVSIVQLIGFLLTLIGYASNYIVSIPKAREIAHSGIWTECHVTKAGTQCLNLVDFVELTKGDRAWVDASRAMMSISFVGQFLVVVLTSLALCRTSTKLVCWLTAGVGVFSVLNGIIGVAVAAARGSRDLENHVKHNVDVDWSFTLFLIGQLTFLLTSVFHYLDSRSKS